MDDAPPAKLPARTLDSTLPAALIVGGVLLLLALLAAWPAIRFGPPTVGDGQIHFYRLAALDWALDNGVWYPRWLPDMGYGFGLPVFNFYPPLSYWAAVIWARVGVPLYMALALGYIAAFWLLGGGVYQWAVALFVSRRAGLLAATSAVVAPYMLFNMVHRGAYPELWGLALFGWGGWFVQALITAQPAQRPRWALALTLLLGLLGLTHALSLLVIGGLLGAYAAALALPRNIRALGWAALVAAGGAALSAVFWWPVLREARFVQLSRTIAPGTLDFRGNFLPLAHLLSLPRIFDPLLTFNAIPASVSWPLLLLALLALLLLRRKRDVWLLAGGALTLALLTLSLSRPLWALLPPLQYVQFPWRMVGPLTVLLALLAGGALTHFSRQARAWLLPLAALLLLGYALPWGFNLLPVNLRDNTHADIPAYEQASGQLGTTATGEYLSIWATTPPPPDTFAAAYANGALPAVRVNHADLPAGMTIISEQPGYDHTTIAYRSETAATLLLNWLFWPDVTATVDGAPLTVVPDPTTGMVTLPDLPAGEHTLVVRQRASAPQRVGAWVSGIAWLALLAVALWLRRGSGHSGGVTAPIHWPSWLAVAVILAAAIALRWFWLDIPGSPFLHSRLQPDGTVQGATHTRVNFGDQLTLLGYDLNGLNLTLYWQAAQPPDRDYSVVVLLQDERGNRYAQHDAQHPAGVPTSRWQPTQYTADSYILAPWPGTPPGDYALLVGVYAGDGNLTVLQNGAPAGQFATVTTVTVPRRPPATLADLQPQTGVQTALGDLTLLGYDVDRSETPAGGDFYLTLYWRAETTLATTPALDLLLDDTVVVQGAPATAHGQPWRAGHSARGPQRIIVPAGFPVGETPIRVRLGNVSAPVGVITITP